MILIIGGAYQGKLDFAKGRFPDSRVCSCENGGIESAAQGSIIDEYQSLVLRQMREGTDPLQYARDNLDIFEDKVVISDDIFSGVVPVDDEQRHYREALGRCLIFLGANAAEMFRVFCGIGTKIK